MLPYQGHKCIMTIARGYQCFVDLVLMREMWWCPSRIPGSPQTARCFGGKRQAQLPAYLSPYYLSPGQAEAEAEAGAEVEGSHEGCHYIYGVLRRNVRHDQLRSFAIGTHLQMSTPL